MDQPTETKMKCKFCPSSSAFTTKNEYLLHIETKHKEEIKDKSFMCSECGKRYKSNSELIVHNGSKCGAVKQFHCKVCGKNLMSAGSLYNHMIRHSGKKSHMCLYCAKLFATAGQLKVHERIHTQDRAFVCEICKKGFCHRQSLITHQTLHTGIKPYLCENCGSSFSCIGNLLKHRKTHSDTCGLIPLTTHRVQHPATRIKVKINTPENARLKTKKERLEDEIKTLKTELNIKDEIEEQIKEEPKEEIKTAVTEQETLLRNNQNDLPNRTEEESLLSNNQNDLPKRTEEESNSEANEFQNLGQMDEPQDEHPMQEADEPDLVDVDHISNCSSGDDEDLLKIKCEQKEPEKNKPKPEVKEKSTAASRRSNRKCKKEVDYLDESAKDEPAETSSECKLCGKKYKKAKWLNRHMKDHQLDGCKFKCNLCKLSFDSKEERAEHRRTAHIDLLTCVECDKIFSHRDGLRYHQNIYHKGVARKSYLYVCEKCGKQFKQRSYLTSHEFSNCSQGPFHQCTICNRNFASKYTMKTHMRTHTDDKKFLCKFCAKSFHWKGQLKIHERSHTGEKPFACTSCPKAFAYRESLLTHMTLHTGVKPYICQGCGLRFSCIGNLIKHKSRNSVECGAWTYKTHKGRLPESGANDTLSLKTETS